MNKFDFIKELTHAVSRNSLKNIEIIGSGNSNNKAEQLYHGLSSGKFKTKQEAHEALYPGSDKKNNFNALCSRLQLRLINSLFFIDSSKKSFTPYSKAYYKCIKELLAAKILIGRGAMNSAVTLARSTLKTAEKFEFYRIQLLLNEIFIGGYFYSDLHGKTFDIKSIYEKNKRLIEITDAEYKAHLLWHCTSAYYSKGTKPPKLDFTFVENLKKEVESLAKKINTIKFKLNYFSSQIIISLAKKKYSKTIQICDNGVLFFKKHKVGRYYQAPLKTFLLYKTQCLIHLNKYKEAKCSLRQAKPFITEAPVSIAIFNELGLLIALRKGEYHQAYLLIESMRKDGRIKTPANTLTESWLLYGAYLEFLIKIGKIEAPSDRPKFRLGKFLNEVPIFSKDKRGMNISILIIQTLHLLADRKYGKVIDRVDALNTYTYRHLRKDSELYRSNCFIRMLMLIPKAGFHRDRVAWRAKSYLKRLKASPMELAFKTTEIEIIAYEELWEYVVNLLDNRIRYY